MNLPRKAILFTFIVLVVAIISASTLFALTASSNKSAYNPGDCVVISGTTQSGGDLLSFTVYNPNNTLIALDQTTSNSTGLFSKQLFCFPTEPRSNFPAGSYVITIKDTTTNEVTNLTIVFTGFETTTTTTTETNTTTPLPTVTKTVTETVNQTITQTQTIIVNNTVTETTTVHETQTLTQTQTKTVTETTTMTQTNTVTETQTQTVKVTNTGVAAGVGVVGLIIGLAAAIAIKRT
jgi:hypothetical protein